jgi:hypothetical protein
MNKFVSPALAALLAATSASAQDLPSRKTGLWEMQMQMQGMPGGMGAQHCVDAKTDADLQRRAMSGEEGARCTQKSFRRTAAGFEMEAECSSAQGKTFVKSVGSGDFNASYTVDTKVRFEPPRHGMRDSAMKITARHIGACPAGMQPGQVRMQGMAGMPSMQGMSPEQMQKMAEEMQRAMGNKK